MSVLVQYNQADQLLVHPTTYLSTTAALQFPKFAPKHKDDRSILPLSHQHSTYLTNAPSR